MYKNRYLAAIKNDYIKFKCIVELLQPNKNCYIVYTYKNVQWYRKYNIKIFETTVFN